MQRFTSAIVVALSLVAPVAFAQTVEGPQAAKEYNRKAVEAFKAGDFETALRNFERAYQLLPDARVRLNLAATNENLHRFDEARMHYEAWLLENPKADKAPAVRKQHARLLERMKAWGKIILDVEPPDAHAEVAGKKFDAFPTAVWLEAGEHDVVVRKEAYVEQTHRVRVQPGARMEVRLVMEKATEPAPVASTPPPAKPAPAGNATPVAKTSETAPAKGAPASGGTVLPLVLRGVAGSVGGLAGLAMFFALVGGASSGGVVAVLYGVRGTDPYRMPLTALFVGGLVALGVGLVVAVLGAAGAVGGLVVSFVVG